MTATRHVAPAARRQPSTRAQTAAADLLASLDRARAALADLIDLGQVVSHLDIDRGPCPVIWIEPNPGTPRALRGAAYRREGFAGCEALTWQATVRGCRVQWMEIRVSGGATC